MTLSFGTARRLWMGVVALLSLVCIFLAVVLWVHGYGRSNSVGALVAIPCFAFAGAMWTIFRKMLFSPQIVCVEATWVFALLPFQIRKSDATYYGALLITCPVLGLFAFESGDALRSRLTAIYEALVTLIWINAALGISLAYQPVDCKRLTKLQVFLYASRIVLLALLTQFSCDQDIWTRDIDSSPCPFPFSVLLVYAFSFAAKYFRGMSAESREGVPAAVADYCLPGCPWHTKVTEAPGLGAEEMNHKQGIQSSIPIRAPTVTERQNAIRVTLGEMVR